MRIYMTDGSKLDCAKIEFTMDGNLFADEYRIVPLTEIVGITDDAPEAEQPQTDDSVYEICRESGNDFEHIDETWSKDYAIRQADDLAEFFKDKKDRPERIVVYEYKAAGKCYEKEVE